MKSTLVCVCVCVRARAALCVLVCVFFRKYLAARKRCQVSSFVTFYLFFFKKIVYFYFMCIGVLLACMYVHHAYAWCPQWPEEGARSSTSGVDSCKLPSEWWEPNLGSLQE